MMPNTVTVKPPDGPQVNISRGSFWSKLAAGFSRFKLFIIGGAAFLLIAGLAVTYFVTSHWLNTYDLIYGGVHAMGIDLSGMTKAEAAEAMDDALAQSYSQKTITVTIDSQSAVVSAEDAEIDLSSGDAAEHAHEMGRVGGYFERLFFVMNSQRSRPELKLDRDLTMNEPAVRSAVENLAGLVRLAPAPPSWDVKEAALELRLGKEGRSVDADSIADKIIEQLRRLDFSAIAAQSEPIEPEVIPVDELYEQIFVEEQDARFELQTSKSGKVVPHVVGVSFDKQALAAALESGKEVISIPIERTVPEITTGYFQSRLFRDQLSSFSTNVIGSAARNNNIRLCAEFINGTIILPGETFSFNEVVGRRTIARGFAAAPAIRNGVMGQEIGGGICQASTTIYNAAMLANLEIADRRAHSLTVGYVPLGRDAAVSWGAIDFAFRNDTDYPIRISGSHVNRTTSYSIAGTNPNPGQTVEIEARTLSHSPYQTTTRVNPELKPGERRVLGDASHGAVAETHRIIKDQNGSVLSRTFEARSTYRRVDIVIETGPEEEEPPEAKPTPEPEPAAKPTPRPTKKPRATPTPKPTKKPRNDDAGNDDD